MIILWVSPIYWHEFNRFFSSYVFYFPHIERPTNIMYNFQEMHSTGENENVNDDGILPEHEK